jgi:hypothetical protein
MECLFITPIITSPDGDEIISQRKRKRAEKKCSGAAGRMRNGEFIFGIVIVNFLFDREEKRVVGIFGQLHLGTLPG